MRLVSSATSTAKCSPKLSWMDVDLVGKGAVSVIMPAVGSELAIVATCVLRGVPTSSGVNSNSAPAAQHAAAKGSRNVISVLSAESEFSVVHEGQASSIALISSFPPATANGLLPIFCCPVMLLSPSASGVKTTCSLPSNTTLILAPSARGMVVCPTEGRSIVIYPCTNTYLVRNSNDESSGMCNFPTTFNPCGKWNTELSVTSIVTHEPQGIFTSASAGDVVVVVLVLRNVWMGVHATVAMLALHALSLK
mmetsp:Transcript_656/g.1203  ORF Transcript_656/g.1203 Transcript_656/m.1203 type:complete len:251 (-) Transcript_656:297-1049(-)